MNTTMKVAMIVIMVTAFGVQGHAQRYRWRNVVPPRSYYSPYYYDPYYRGGVNLIINSSRRSASSSYKDDDMYKEKTPKAEKKAPKVMKINGVTIEADGDWIYVEGGGNKVPLNTKKKNNHLVKSKKGPVVITTENGNAKITAYEKDGKTIIGTYEL